MRIQIFIFSLLVVSACVDAEGTRPTKKDDASDLANRDKRNSEYADISHQTYPRLERRISNVPLSTSPRMYPAFFPSGIRPYTYYRKQKPQLPPYAVQMEPLMHFSQRDPLYDPTSLNTLPQPHNELTKQEDQVPDNNHLSENYYGPPKHQYIDRPVYIKEPEPIIEIIIKEANTTAAPVYQEPLPLPPKKKKEEVQVFYVKYKKNPHGTGKDSVIYDKPIPALSPIQDDHEEEQHEEHYQEEYAAPVTYAPPVATTTIRAIIKPDSETFHADSGIHVTFGGNKHNPHAETYSHDDDIVESAPQPALSHPEGRRFPNTNNNGPTTTTFTQEYKPEQRLPQPYRPFNFNAAQQHNVNQRPHNFHQQALPAFNNNNFNAPPPALNSQLFNNPVPNRFPPPANFGNSRPSFGPPLKQGPNSKPYQFERPQFNFPRQQTHFPVHQTNQQPPTHQNPPVFNHKPSFQAGPGPVTKFTQSSPHSFQLSQQPHQPHHPQQVFHQGPNSFSFQTNFAEPTGFNSNQQGHSQGQNQNFQGGNNHFQQQTYQTIQQTRPQQHHHVQTNQHQGQNQQQHIIQQKPQIVQSQGHHQSQSLPLVPNFNHQQFSNNQNFQVSGHQQQQQLQLKLQQQNLLNQHQHIIPPGGELIPALPKFEQHITSHHPVGSESQVLSQQNFTSQIQQQFRDFPQHNQQNQPIQHVPQTQPINHNFNQNFQGQSVTQSEQNPQSNNNIHTQIQSSRHVDNSNLNSNLQQNHNVQQSFDFNQNYYKQSTQSTPSSYVTSPRPQTTRLQTIPTTTRTTTTTTTTTTPKPESTTFNLKDLNIELPDEVPDDLREQLLSSGILKNAQISVLDYDKVGDIPISALPPDQLANFYGAGGAQQLASGSETKPTVLRPDGSSVPINHQPVDDLVDEMEPVAQASTMNEIRAPVDNKQAVEMKVVRYDPETKQGQQVHDSYVKEGATQIQPVVLNDQSYNRYLPLKVSGTKFPIPDVPELKGKNINSVVVLAPVDYNFYKQRVVRAAAANLEDDIQLIKNDALKKLVKDPSQENYKEFLDHEKEVKTAQQSVILLVTGSEPQSREIFMYDVGTMSVSKLDGELSAAFVDAAESNTSEAQEDDKATMAASNLVETKVPAPEGLAQSQALTDDDLNDELQSEASEFYETRVPIIDPMQGDLEAEGSEQLEQFVDISGLQTTGNDEDLMPAASNDAQTIVIQHGYKKQQD